MSQDFMNIACNSLQNCLMGLKSQQNLVTKLPNRVILIRQILKEVLISPYFVFIANSDLYATEQVLGRLLIL